MQNDADGQKDKQKVLVIYVRSLSWYSIGLIEITSSNGIEEIKKAGSGTLVQIGEIKGILTAAHVLKDLQKSNCTVGIVTFNGGQKDLQKLTIDIHAMQHIRCDNKNGCANGPDLALIKLCSKDIDSLEAKNSFFNLSKSRDDVLECNFPKKKAFDCLSGVVWEYTEEVHPKIENTRTKLFTSIFTPGKFIFKTPHEGFDLVEFTPQEDVGYTAPESYGGVSGGALWRIFTNEEHNGDSSVTGIWLYGVAFYQSDQDEKGKRTITCHGPKSIYERLFTAVRPAQ